MKILEAERFQAARLAREAQAKAKMIVKPDVRATATHAANLIGRIADNVTSASMKDLALRAADTLAGQADGLPVGHPDADKAHAIVGAAYEACAMRDDGGPGDAATVEKTIRAMRLQADSLLLKLKPGNQAEKVAYGAAQRLVKAVGSIAGNLTYATAQTNALGAAQELGIAIGPKENPIIRHARKRADFEELISIAERAVDLARSQGGGVKATPGVAAVDSDADEMLKIVETKSPIRGPSSAVVSALRAWESRPLEVNATKVRDAVGRLRSGAALLKADDYYPDRQLADAIADEALSIVGGGPSIPPSMSENDVSRWGQNRGDARRLEFDALSLLDSLAASSAVYGPGVSVVVAIRKVSVDPWNEDARGVLRGAKNLLRTVAQASRGTERTFGEQIATVAESVLAIPSR